LLQLEAEIPGLTARVPTTLQLALSRRNFRELVTVETFGIILSLPGVFVLGFVYCGAVRSREIFGPGFYLVHRICFFLVVPALANFLLLRKDAWTRWQIIPFLCAPLAFWVVLLEYYVYESLYGVDGTGGPFGMPPPF
jgi:hypothetical protein